MDLVRRELGILPVADHARFAERSRVEDRVFRGGLVVVAALASGSNRRRGRCKTAGTRHHRRCADVVNLVGVGHMASGANAQVARESHALIVGGSQHVRIR